MQYFERKDSAVAQEVVGFEGDIRPFFREVDVSSMGSRTRATLPHLDRHRVRAVTVAI